MKKRYPYGKECGEVVFPGHPDKLADAIVFREDRRALVGIEVAVSLSRVFVTGRIGTTRRLQNTLDIEKIVRSVYRGAGYSKRWRPGPDDLVIDTRGLIRDVIGDGERGIRSLSDDQSITVGYAIGSP